MIRAICRAFLRLAGWELGNAPPNLPKYVFVAAPHTSNWDFVFMMAASGAFGLRISWMGKAAIFRPPFGWLMRRLGGVPVRRDAAHNLVEQVVEEFATRDRLVLAVAAEGTRARAEYWKSGFYHIARKAGVPIVISILDFKSKMAGFGPAIVPTGDLTADMDQIRAAYEGVVGKHPANQGPIRLREEAGIGPSGPSGG